MKKIIMLVASLAIIITACNNQSGTTGKKDAQQKHAEQQDTNNQSATDLNELHQLFAQAGTIKVYEPLRYLIGETDSANSYYEITLEDIAKYHGKVCPGIATGFFMFQDVIYFLTLF